MLFRSRHAGLDPASSGLQEQATQTVLEQAEVLSAGWAVSADGEPR